MKNPPYLANAPPKRRPGRPPKHMAAAIGHNGGLTIKKEVKKAGWRIAEWCNAISCATSSFYNFLERDGDILQSVKIGRMRIVLTAPEVFLAAKYARQLAQSPAPPLAPPGPTPVKRRGTPPRKYPATTTSSTSPPLPSVEPRPRRATASSADPPTPAARAAGD